MTKHNHSASVTIPLDRYEELVRISERAMIAAEYIMDNEFIMRSELLPVLQILGCEPLGKEEDDE